MSSISPLSSAHKIELKQLHDDYGSKVRITGCSAVAAAFLLIGALIVITCGCLCLMLPGVNVINHVILPAVVPGIFGIILSIPLILLTVKYNQDKNFIRQEMIGLMVNHLERYGVPEMARKQRPKFILMNFLDWQTDPQNAHKLVKNKFWTDEYQGKIIEELKEKMGKDKKNRNIRQEKIATALDTARTKINQKR